MPSIGGNVGREYGGVSSVHLPTPTPVSPPKKKKKKKKILGLRNKETSGLGNPDVYKVVKALELGKYLILLINYPDCKNYEGNKILVFRDITLIDLVNQKLIDPHFFEDSKYLSPLVRFVPTNEGWALAVKFVEMMNNEC